MLRKVTDNIFQSDFLYALQNGGKYKYIVSVAKECKHPNSSLHIPQEDNSRIDFWDLLRVASLLSVADVYNTPTLIHCCAGVSRSVAYSLAYLISKGLSLEDAKKSMGIDYSLHPAIENSLKDFEAKMRDRFFYKLFRYALIQMEASQNDSPVPEERVNVIRRYVGDGSKILIIGCTSTEYEAFSKFYNVECVHLNVLGKVGKFLMFEYNDYPDSSFDAVLAFDTLEHTYDPFIVIGETRRVLKDGGIFYHSTPTIHDSMKMPWHISLFSADSWKWIFEWWDFSVLEEKIDPDRITQVLRKGKYTKFESYHKLAGIS